MTLITDADEVVQLFCRAPDARRRFRQWETSRRRRHVVEHVMAHKTRILYELTVDDITRALPRNISDHALDEIKGDKAKEIERIDKWNPDFAFTHVFHYALEAIGTFPRWGDIYRFFQEDERANVMLMEPAKREVEATVRDGWGRQEARAAMRWRVGNFYYSFLREAYAVVRLRAAGLDVRAHPLADALFRVDGWCGNKIISIYVRNPRFRDGYEGRKPQVERILEGGDPSFEFHPVVLPPASEFAKSHLPDDSQLRAAIRELSKR
ncbi:hypothetical protein ACQP1V_03580 [Microtetraspora malaysiensis]|uniref:hypothetical protein n=1 Tax=Microtetraspora malaysiensis TaxID=161358 RepID=UPI003D8AC995